MVLALVGLALLGLSITGAEATQKHPPVLGLIIWLAACGAGAALLIVVHTRYRAGRVARPRHRAAVLHR